YARGTRCSQGGRRQRAAGVRVEVRQLDLQELELVATPDVRQAPQPGAGAHATAPTGLQPDPASAPTAQGLRGGKKSFLGRLEERVWQLSDGEALLFLDECSLKLHATLTRRWSIRGQQFQVGSWDQHGKTHLFGAVDAFSGQVHYCLT